MKNNTKRALEILDLLRKRYPMPQTLLTWKTPWELLVATVLAAQCTDVRVNKVTPGFFKRWPTVYDLAEASLADVEEKVRSTGFFRQKAKNLIATATIIKEQHGGETPQTMGELVRLPGVARKTANIVLSNGFGIHEGIAVDTHVRRISFRLGLTQSTNPQVIEKDLIPLFPRDSWGELNHNLVWFGRDVCQARKPSCSTCELEFLCPKQGMA